MGGDHYQLTEPRRMRERVPGGFLIHLDGPSGDDMTLCGYAYEGSCADSDSGVEPVSRGKVNCRTCLAIIRLCKRVPAKILEAIP